MMPDLCGNARRTLGTDDFRVNAVGALAMQ
jgi:hypothetical protein